MSYADSFDPGLIQGAAVGPRRTGLKIRNDKRRFVYLFDPYRNGFCGLIS